MNFQTYALKTFWLGAICTCLFSLSAHAETALLEPKQQDATQQENKEQEVENMAIEAYIYAYPLVTMDMTREVTTNIIKPEGFKAPMGQIANIREYPTPAFKDVTAPNADTLYSAAFFDVSKEPYILHVPNENGRYYLMPILSGWTDVIADPGTRTTGTEEQDFVVTGPNWKGELPPGLKEYKSSANLVWLLGRTYSTGTPEDYTIVHEIQDQYSLKPLSAYGKSYTPLEGKVDSGIDTKTPVRDQVNALDGSKFFTRFVELLKNNPPQANDKEIVGTLAKLGIVPGQDFDFSKLDPKIQTALSNATKKGLEKIIAHKSDSGKFVNGWNFVKPIGEYGNNYLQRAFVAVFGLGANLPEDAIYPNTDSDSQGNPLSGKNKYILSFEKGKEPPVKGFWSLTMYDDQYFFVENPLKRYTLSQRDKLKQNADGTTDLYIQKESPGKDKETNWLPAPEGNFVLMFRFYWPEESLISRS